MILTMRRFLPHALSSLLLAACATPATPPQPEAPTVDDKAAVTRPFPDDAVYDLLVAEVALRQHDIATALQHYATQARKTGDLDLIETAARLARYVDDEPLAIEFAQQWIQQQDDTAEPHFILAMALSHQKRPLAALPHMARVLELGGNSNFAALAATALSLNEADQANFYTELSELAATHPSEPTIKIARALMLQYRGDAETALTVIKEVLSEEPDNAHALLIETRTLLQLGRRDEAIAQLKYAVDQHPRHKQLRHDLARTLVKEDIFQAKAHYEVLVNQNPNDSDLLLELMLINREIGNNADATAQLQTLSKDPAGRSRANYLLGRLAEEDQNWPDAMRYYEQATGSAEFDPASRRLASISLASEGDEKALERLKTLRLANPQYAPTIYLLEAEVLRKSDQRKRGFNLLTGAIKAYPDEIQLRYARSLFAERMGNIAAVEEDLRHIIDLEPDNAAALNALGYSLANLTSRLDEAEALVRRALALTPDDAAVIDSLGWILFLKGDITTAAELLGKAFSLSADHEIAAHYGEALWHLDKKEEARAAWRAGLKDKPDSSVILDTLKRLKLIDE
jgi:tetratricopeptide (TPR) repeat protein